MKVVTWQSASGRTIDITPAQEQLLRRHGVWPKDARGEEYASVSMGLHHGRPTYSDDELLRLCGVRAEG